MHTRVVPDRVIVDLRSVQPRVVARIATAIQKEVGRFAGPVLGEPRARIETAVAAGLRALSDLLVGRARPLAGVDELFRQLGRAEAMGGRTFEGLRAALDIATRETWAELHRVALAHGLTPTVMGKIVDLLFEQADHLCDGLEAGYLAGVEERDADRHIARRRLGQKLVDGAEVTEIRQLAAVAQWVIPDFLLVVQWAVSEVARPVAADQFDTDVLVTTDSTDVLVVCDARVRGDCLEEIRRAWGSATFAVSLPSSLEHFGDALRLVRRALWLVERGVIPGGEIVDCADHEVSLWLHAEPILQERLARRLLAPLDDETPRSREVLASTLLIWLEQRASAPAIARQLEVHPQTVRYRMRKLDRLFGERLKDPSLSFPLLLALKSTLPSWLSTTSSARESPIKGASSSGPLPGSAPANAATTPPAH